MRKQIHKFLITKKLFAVVSLSALLLTGCNGKGTSFAEHKWQDVSPSVVNIGDTKSGGYSYLVDKNTGVVYLQCYRGGITVMLNKDGSPITAEQLGIEYKD